MPLGAGESTTVRFRVRTDLPADGYRPGVFWVKGSYTDRHGRPAGEIVDWNHTAYVPTVEPLP
jgi:hypothetical protein